MASVINQHDTLPGP